MEFFLVFSSYSFFAIACAAHNLKWLLLVIYTYARESTIEARVLRREKALKIVLYLFALWNVIVLALCTSFSSQTDKVHPNWAYLFF